MAEGSGLTQGKSPWCFDPVSDLPGDVAALCLSFLDVRLLLHDAQRVNHAWQHAIDGGLPAVWHDVRLDGIKLDDVIADVAQKSHGAIKSLRVHSPRFKVSAEGVNHLRSLCNLRILYVDLSMFGGTLGECSISPVLPHLSLLEDLSVNGSHDFIFPSLQVLKKASCMFCRSVKGLRNLPSLTKLDVCDVLLDGEDAWPASLRDITIFGHQALDLHIIDRIAALQQPIR